MNRRLAGPDHSLNAPLRSGRRERVAGLAGRREREPGDRARRGRRARPPPRRCCSEAMARAQRARAPHPDRAPAEGRADDARGSVARSTASAASGCARSRCARSRSCRRRSRRWRPSRRPAPGCRRHAKVPRRTETLRRPPHRAGDGLGDHARCCSSPRVAAKHHGTGLAEIGGDAAGGTPRRRGCSDMHDSRAQGLFLIPRGGRVDA